MHGMPQAARRARGGAGSGTETSAAAELRRAKAKANREKHELAMLTMIRTMKLPEPRREHRFAAIAVGWDPENPAANRGKKLRPLLEQAGLGDWKFDFCWPEHGLVLEIEGAPGRGRHTSAAGFKEDCRKYNEAWLMGWSVLRVTGDQVHSGAAISLLRRAFKKLERQQPNG